MNIENLRREKGHEQLRGQQILRCALLALAALWLPACARMTAEGDPEGHQDEHGDHSERAAENWSITAWGEHFEVFSEIAPPVAGETTSAHIHVTHLDDFSPLTIGRVELVLSSAAGEQVFSADEPGQPGIFNLQIEPSASAELAILFRIETSEASESIAGGRLRVGDETSPSRQLSAPAPKGGESGDGGEPLDFSKEEQWRSAFASSWVRAGRLASSIGGEARLRPPAGGEALLSAPFDGTLVAAADWPYPGRVVSRGEALFHLVPRVAAEQSLNALEATATAFVQEKDLAAARLARLDELLEIEAIARREVEAARAKARTLEARSQAASLDLEAARSSRRGGKNGAFSLKAPIAGTFAQVSATPGATVEAGEVLARLVRTDSLWLEVAIRASDAARLSEHGVAGVVLTGRRSWRFEEGVRQVALAPELASSTGKAQVILEIPPATGLILGRRLRAKILLREQREGIVIPSAAVIDDGGVPVVYLQLAGERFLRQQVEIVERQGERVLVEGLRPGQRLVEKGGEAIRRASLMASGGGHGHVH